MLADQHRQILRYGKLEPNQHDRLVKKTDKLYRRALKLTKKSGTGAHRPGIVLNYSVFLFEFKKDAKKALKMCKDEY